MDEQARAELAEFCAAQHRRLVGSLTLHCGDPHVAAELAQEALAKACAHWPSVRRMDAPGAWLHRVAINLASSHFRRRKAERSARERFSSRIPDDELVASSADAADALAVRRAVAALPLRQRTALVYRYYSDLSVEQTAEAMGCATGTVKSLTSQAITALRTHAGLLDLTADSDPSLTQERSRD